MRATSHGRRNARDPRMSAGENAGLVVLLKVLQHEHRCACAPNSVARAPSYHATVCSRRSADVHQLRFCKWDCTTRRPFAARLAAYSSVTAPTDLLSHASRVLLRQGRLTIRSCQQNSAIRYHPVSIDVGNALTTKNCLPARSLCAVPRPNVLRETFAADGGLPTLFSTDLSSVTSTGLLPANSVPSAMHGRAVRCFEEIRREDFTPSVTENDRQELEIAKRAKQSIATCRGRSDLESPPAITQTNFHVMACYRRAKGILVNLHYYVFTAILTSVVLHVN